MIDLHLLATPKFIILYVFIASTLYIHYRGKVRLGFLRQLTDHSTFMAPYNLLMYLFSSVPRTPILKTSLIPELAELQKNWKTIREEALGLWKEGQVKAAEKHNDLAFHTFFRSGWKRFYLKWYGDFLPSAKQFCPKTVELLRRVPNINGALFALMSPHSELGNHRDPFAGSLRYHLGLKTPNSEQCRIYIDGIPHTWRDGEDLLFDETYIHRFVNDTDEHRLIFFADVKRPLRSKGIAALNDFFSSTLMRATATQNIPAEKVGFFNKTFQYFHYLQIFGKRIKKKNVRLYYALKYSLLAGLGYLIFIF